MKRIITLIAVLLLAMPVFAVEAVKAPVAPVAAVAAPAPAVVAPAAAPTTTVVTTTVTAPTAPAATEPVVVPDPEKDLGGFMTLVLNSFKNKNWGMLAGLVIMLLVWVTRKFLPKIPANYLPWVSAAMGVVTSMATDLTTGGTWYVALFNGVLLGAAASGMWSLVGKHVFVQKPAAPAAPAAPTA